MAFDPLTMNAGTGGSSLATDSFTDTDAVVKVMPYGAVAFGPLNGPYAPVTTTAGFPVTQQTGATFAVTGTFYQATQPVSGPLTDAQLRASAVPVSLASVPSHAVTNAGTFAVQPGVYYDVPPALGDGDTSPLLVDPVGRAYVVVASSALPTGAATAARQDTGNTSLSSIDGKLPALGQALAAASVPVVLTAAQVTTLTPPAAITGFATESTLSSLNGKVTACNTGAVVLAAGTAAVGKLAANAGVTIGAVEIAAAQTLGTVTTVGTVTTCSTVTTVSTLTGGGVAHDGADSGNPVKVGAKASSAVQTLVADDDRTNLTADLAGRLIVGFGPRELVAHSTTTISSSTSETTVLAAGAAGVFHDLTTVTVANTSATAVRVDFKDATSGTVRFSLYAPAGQTVGFSTPGDPVTQAAAANNWTATCSASVADVRIFVKARKTK